MLCKHCGEPIKECPQARKAPNVHREMTQCRGYVHVEDDWLTCGGSRVAEPLFIEPLVVRFG